MQRTQAREIAFCLFFERTFGVMTEVRASAPLFDNPDFSEDGFRYIISVLEAYELHKDEIDQMIEHSSRNWRLSRIPRTDISILRLAICEMKFCDDVPPRVAVNEAVELSKRYCADGSPAFINGVLDGCIKEL